MRTKQIQVYKFSELKPEIQEKIIEREMQIADETLDLDYWADDVKQRLEEMGFEDVKLEYDLSYSQGSGLCFYGKLDLKRYLNQNIEMWLKFRKLLDIYVSCGIKHKRDYCSEAFVEPEIDRYSTTIKQYNEMEALAEEFREHLEALKEGLCDKFKKEGYEEIEYRTSEKNIREYLDDYEFNEKGEIR